MLNTISDFLSIFFLVLMANLAATSGFIPFDEPVVLTSPSTDATWMMHPVCRAYINFFATTVVAVRSGNFQALMAFPGTNPSAEVVRNNSCFLHQGLLLTHWVLLHAFPVIGDRRASFTLHNQFQWTQTTTHRLFVSSDLSITTGLLALLPPGHAQIYLQDIENKNG